MIKKILTILFASLSLVTSAQTGDSLFVNGGKPLAIMYRSKLGEDVFILARRFHVPPAVLADVNKVGYNYMPPPGSLFLIPLGAYNQIFTRPANPNESRPIYYKVVAGDNAGKISRVTGVSKSDLEEWNGLSKKEIKTVKVLLVGWVQYDATRSVGADKSLNGGVKPAKPAPVPPVPVSVAKDSNTNTNPVDSVKSSSEAEAIFLQQTNNGQNVITEKGTVAFFAGQSRQTKEPYFAFFDKAPKGTILKVYNLGNEKSVYVKVLGPLPKTKQYYNAVIGISSLAKEQLGVRDNRAWCELSYSGQ